MSKDWIDAMNKKYFPSHIWHMNVDMSNTQERCNNMEDTSRVLSEMFEPNDKQFGEIKSKYDKLIKVSIPYINKLDTVVTLSNAIIGISTVDGVVLYSKGKNNELEGTEYREGAILSENKLDNTVFSLCLKEDDLAMTIGSQHGLDILGNWSYFASPMHDELGNAIAVLYMIYPVKFSCNSFLHMVDMAAMGIEEQLAILKEQERLVNVNGVLSNLSSEIVNAASLLSHEIRNSLSTIGAYVQLLELEYILQSDQGDKILSEIGRINKLLDGFKNLTMSFQPKFMRHSLKEILKSTFEIMQAKASMNNVDMHLYMDKADVYVEADVDSMKQVFINIIVNAIQAMAGGGRLDISLSVDPRFENAIITFKDTGEGISKKDLSEIFKLFYTTKKEGSGMGLAICNNVIKAHGGNIKVDSKLGKGTTFVIELPYCN
ncbi:MAG: ATP-binding protein [Xylanivirga thermophila]|jgi:signal transduction histidine kinase|uniref:ATP-binding protein n=1 Tax=Xylanivirga thermophila TaxID=2496273 RepID=UPI00101CBB8A|nr:ATP-binding protein [Xylanivirga thermophila]